MPITRDEGETAVVAAEAERIRQRDAHVAFHVVERDLRTAGRIRVT